MPSFATPWTEWPRCLANLANEEQIHSPRSDGTNFATPSPRTPVRTKYGPARALDLPDIIDLLTATGARTAELLALRWSDFDLSATRATVTISGTLAYVRGKGLIRQEWTKTVNGYRTLYLPVFAVGLLLGRRVRGSQTAKPNRFDAVFPSEEGTWTWPNNLRTQLRAALEGTEFEGLTPKTLRKTAITMIALRSGSEAAAAFAGHSMAAVTETHYISRPSQAPDVRADLDGLAP